MSDFARIGTNSGHGHAWPRPDGAKARCGGTVLCRECAADASLVERWRRQTPNDAGATPGPIDPQFHELMNGIARLLDEAFNGPDCKAEDKKVGFFLATYEMAAPGRFNYISNSDKTDVHAMLREIAARLEGRIAAEGPRTTQ
jgi:hypothetical protein